MTGGQLNVEGEALTTKLAGMGEGLPASDAAQRAGQGGGPGTGGSSAGAGAGMAAGMLTSYLINRYTNAPEGVSPIAGATVGGAVAGGVGGVGAAGASASLGGAAAGSAGAIAGGAVMGGAGGVIAHVASQMIAKHIFGQGKESGRDVASRQFYSRYNQQGRKQAQQAGFKSSSEALMQPYKWMGQEAKDYREAIARGESPTLSGKEHAAMMAPEYRPSEWEAWVGAMGESGASGKAIMDATAYYMSDAGQRRMGKSERAFKRGEEWYLDPKNDPKGKTDMTPEDRQARWTAVQEQKRKNEIPWMQQGFKDMYQQEYGHMKEAPKLMSARQFSKRIGKQSWFRRHGQMDRYERLQNQYVRGLGYARIGGMAGAYGPQGRETAASRDVSERTGIYSTMRQHDTRDIWGQGFETYDNADLGEDIDFDAQRE
jgi:hypothetical protein